MDNLPVGISGFHLVVPGKFAVIRMSEGGIPNVGIKFSFQLFVLNLEYVGYKPLPIKNKATGFSVARSNTCCANRLIPLICLTIPPPYCMYSSSIFAITTL